MLTKVLLIISAISLFYASASSHEVPQEPKALDHTRELDDRFASLDPTLCALGITRHDLSMICQCFSLAFIGESAGCRIRGLPARGDITFLTPKQIVEYVKYRVEEEKDHKYSLTVENPLAKMEIPPKGLGQFLGGSICAVLARVILCNPEADGWSVVDSKTMEDRIRLLLTLNVKALYLGRVMNEWMTILEEKLELRTKNSLMPILMKIANEALRKEEVENQFERNLKYKEDIDRIEQNRQKDSRCSDILKDFYGNVHRFRLDEEKWRETSVEISEEEMVELIRIAMDSADFVRTIPHLLDFAANDTQQNKIVPQLTTKDKQKIKHVAELIKTLRGEMRRDQKREYMDMVRKSRIDSKSFDKLEEMFDMHVSGYL